MNTLTKIKTKIKQYHVLSSCYYAIYNPLCKLLTLISPKLNTKLTYFIAFGRKINLDNPQTLNEKIQKLKLDSYASDKLVIQCADKLAVRDYVIQCGCEDILVPLIGTCDNVEDIKWDSLPPAFVIKWNFGCGYNIICPNKELLNVDRTKKQLKKWGSSKFYLIHSEMQYKSIPPQMIVEKYICPKAGTLPEDYKVYCFNGEPKFVMLCIDRETKTKFLYFDEKFNLCRNFSRDGLALDESFTIEKPKGYEKLFYYSRKLAKPFKFVRADFYLVDGYIYFGELTFTPGTGFDNRRIPEIDKYFGSLLTL